MNAIKGNQHEYLCLLSLKEAINVCTLQNSNALISYTVDIWQILFERANLENEEGTRNVISECLGKLAVGYVY